MIKHCYAYEENGNLVIPFLDYLQKYDFEGDTEKIASKKRKNLAQIKAYIDHVANRGGKYDLPPVAEQYQNTELGIIKIKESETLIRVAFITFVEDKMILLGAMEKPRLYEKNKKKKVDKNIQEFLVKMEEYRQDYLQKKISVELPE